VSGEVEATVEAIGQLDLEGLRSEWARSFGAPPPLRSVAILRMLIAWRIQAHALGGLDADTRRALARTGRIKAEGLELGIGTRLTRNWQGRTHEVVVEAEGFRWQGASYRSLSAVASAIAGSRWNGPRFFGLRGAT
jgi:Protein of unknown function (DUF2924)